MEKQAVRLSRPAQSVLSNFSSKKIKCWEQCEIPRAEYDVNGMALRLTQEQTLPQRLVSVVGCLIKNTN